MEKRDYYWVKKLFVTKGEQTSLQSHADREEFWLVLQGTVRALKGGKATVLSAGETCHIQQGEKHRLSGVTDGVVLEVALGKPRENDIIRYEDDYNRK